ncbi:MAG: restriction endonuclease subunit S [Rhodocyclaceae bacterium]
MDKNVGIACRVVTGKLDANQAVKGGRYPFFTCAEYPDTIDNFAFDDDVVLVAGNNAQGNFHVSRFSGKFNAYQRTYILNAKDGFNIDYIYYALKLELKRLRERSQGSQTKFLTMPILTGIHLRNLSFEEQSVIADVLKALDAKIDCNIRINAELEAMAKTLYDYWFVQFDFPDANGKPYKSSGGKMVYNATLKREIPVGWHISTIGETFRTHLGGTPSRDVDEYWKPGDVNWLSSGENPSTFVVAPDEKISTLGLQNSPAKLLPRGTVILSIVRHLRASILGIDAATNQSVVGIVETEKLKHYFIYPYIVREIPRLMALRTGAQQPHINKGALDESLLVIPDDTALSAYSSKAAPFFLQIQNNLRQNQQLAQLRDWLLPLLMNGQVTVT